MSSDSGADFCGVISALCFVPVFATAAILSYVKANGWTKAAFMRPGERSSFADAWFP
ncbi:MAG: hypothetical protein ACLRSW_13840 [Christensenellaceae bacterium]